MQRFNFQSVLLFISLSAYSAVDFDGKLNQTILSSWQDITSKYISLDNRNITSIDSKTFNGLSQLEQLYVNNITSFFSRN